MINRGPVYSVNINYPVKKYKVILPYLPNTNVHSGLGKFKLYILLKNDLMLLELTSVVFCGLWCLI